MKKLEPNDFYSYLNVFQPPSTAVDVAFIFGTSRPDPAIIAAQMFHSRKVSRILVTGGISESTPTKQTEAEFHKDILVTNGVPIENIFVESRSSNTLENVLYGREILKAEYPCLKSVTVICRWYHSRRVLMTLKKHMPSTAAFTHLYDSPFDVNGNFCVTQMEKAWSEYLKIPAYLAKGDLAELD